MENGNYVTQREALPQHTSQIKKHVLFMVVCGVGWLDRYFVDMFARWLATHNQDCRGVDWSSGSRSNAPASARR